MNRKNSIRSIAIFPQINKDDETRNAKLIVIEIRNRGDAIMNYADISNNLMLEGAQASAIDVTLNIIFERLYLVSGLRNIALFFTMPLVSNSPPLTVHQFLDFRAIFFRSCPFFFSPSIPSESRYLHSFLEN